MLQVRRWAVLLRVHRRHKYLSRVFRCLKRLGKGREVLLCIMADRPSGDVVDAVDRQVTNLPDNFQVEVVEAPCRLVDEGVENFMQALRTHMGHVRSMGEFDAFSIWDDDMWFRTGGVKELRRHMDSLAYDRIEARSAFLWDHSDQVNTRFPVHWQAILARHYPRDEFPLHIITHATEKVAMSPHVCHMERALVNAGYLDADEREDTWDTYKRAGKLDAHTLCLKAEPRLVPTEEVL